MSIRALLLDWSVDGATGLAFLVSLLAAGWVYVIAARIGTRRDRRGRSWPRGRTFCFLAGLSVLAVDLYSGIGTEADKHLSVHMFEHTVMWVVVAPLLAAGGPLRLAFFALPRTDRRVLARWLHSRPVAALTKPVGSVGLFAATLLITHLPAVYGLMLHDEYLHEAEHGVYLLTALLVWASFLGVDPLPHRPGPRGRLICMAACMVPMVLIAVWLGTAADPVYARYAQSSLHDQRVAATIMWAGCLPAFAIAVIWRLRLPQLRRERQLGSEGVRQRQESQLTYL